MCHIVKLLMHYIHVLGINFLQFCNLSDTSTVGQSFDGENVMSGQKEGVQTKLKQISIRFIHSLCMTHKLNLVIVETCKYLNIFIICLKNVYT